MAYRCLWVFLFVFLFTPAFMAPAFAQELGGTEQSLPIQSIADRVVLGASEEVHRGTAYRATYEPIDYPGGDVPSDYGVCTDLVIRSFRKADIDIQQLLHEDRKAHPEVYPIHLWTNKNPDRNIDHRRCPNLLAFLKRHSLVIDKNRPDSWSPGDVLFFQREDQFFPWHVGIVSGNRGNQGDPRMFHLFPPRANEDSAIDERQL